LKATIKAISALAMFAFAAPAFAGGVNVYDDGESKLKMGAKVFVDMTQKTTKDTAGNTTARTTGFNFNRAYLTAKYNFNSDWMMRVTTDAAVETKAGLGKTTNVFVKYAYVEGKLVGDAAVLRFGISHNPWIDYEQGLWKHRYFSKVTSDEFKYDDSADLGIGLKGELADGMVKYWATEVNGGGYGNISATDATDTKLRVGIYPVKGLTLDVGYNTGYRGKKTFNTTPGKQTMYQIMATYGMGHDFRVGANYIANKDRTTKTANGVDSNTYAVWGWTKVGAGFGLVGRYEVQDAFSLSAIGTRGAVQEKRARTIIGLDYSPVKHVDVTIGYTLDKTTNDKYVLGTNTRSTQIGMWTQYKY